MKECAPSTTDYTSLLTFRCFFYYYFFISGLKGEKGDMGSPGAEGECNCEPQQPQQLRYHGTQTSAFSVARTSGLTATDGPITVTFQHVFTNVNDDFDIKHREVQLLHPGWEVIVLFMFFLPSPFLNSPNLGLDVYSETCL